MAAPELSSTDPAMVPRSDCAEAVAVSKSIQNPKDSPSSKKRPTRIVASPECKFAPTSLEFVLLGQMTSAGPTVLDDRNGQQKAAPTSPPVRVYPLNITPDILGTGKFTYKVAHCQPC